MRRCYGCMKEYNEKFEVCPYCGYVADTVPEVKSHLLPGTKLSGRFVVGKAIGHGGFGITYIAWDEKIQKTVAVKEYFPNAFSTRSTGETLVSCFNKKGEAFLREGIKKMLDEAKRLSKFSKNENIVDISDYFEENNTAYIVMEYLEGKDLKRYLEENGEKLAPEKAVEIILPVLNALEDMHKENLIHRDISPDNIFLCDNGKVKLLDFGSARLAVEDSDKSLSVMVKRGYAPKEQYASRSKQGTWTDVYAVCATLYRMITGKTPVESTEREDEPLKSFSEYGVKGYDGLEKVIFKGLEVDYTNRIGSITELRVMLTKPEEKKSVPVAGQPKKPTENKSEPTPKQPETPDKPKSKLNMKAIIAAVAAVAVFVVGIVAAVKFISRNNLENNQTSESVVSVSTTSATTTSATTVSSYRASENLIKKAMERYEKELSKWDNYSSACVVDVNGDGISEVICSPEEVGMQFMMTYTEKSGLSVVDLLGHSAMMPEIYISEDNCIYVRDDGHNQGTAFHHYAAVYEIDESGFVRVGEVEGDEPEDFNWEDEALFNEMDAKYEKLFEEKLKKIVGDKEFKSYSEVANTKNPVEYMESALSVDLYSEYKFQQHNDFDDSSLDTITETINRIVKTTTRVIKENADSQKKNYRTKNKTITETLKYGVVRTRNIEQSYEILSDGSEIVVDERILSEEFDRKNYSATYEELLPAAKKNREAYKDIIDELFELTNNYRVENGLKPLILDETLCETACVRAEELAWSENYTNYRPAPSFKFFSSVFKEAGITKGDAGENKAWVFSDIEEFWQRWINDEDNKNNILNPDFAMVGIGVAANPDPEGKLCWVQHFWDGTK